MGPIGASSMINRLPRSCLAAPGRRDQLLARAGLYHLIAQGITYPDAGHAIHIQSATRDLLEAAAQGALPRPIEPALREVLRAWRTAELAALRAEYSRLFLGSGLVPLREGGYGDAMRFAGQPADIADLNGFYLAFGFELSGSPPDHLGTEAEFVSLLHLKAQWALVRGRPREVRLAEHALGRFLEAHLGRWTTALQGALQDARAMAPYATLAAVLRTAVETDCFRLRVKPIALGRDNHFASIADEALVCPFANGDHQDP